MGQVERRDSLHMTQVLLAKTLALHSSKFAGLRFVFIERNSQAYFLPLEMKTNNECTIEEAE